MAVSAIRAKQVILLGGLMLLEGEVRPGAIAFLLKSYLDLADTEKNARGLTIKTMADNYGCRPQTGYTHVAELKRHKVLVRNLAGRYHFNWEYIEKLNNLETIF